jgi:glucose/arabinose dehydrogenase
MTFVMAYFLDLLSQPAEHLINMFSIKPLRTNQEKTMTITRKFLLLLALFSLVSLCTRCEYLKGKIIHILGSADRYKAEGDPNSMRPTYKDADASREKIKVRLAQVASGFVQPVDIQFSPAQPEIALVAEKGGALKAVSLRTKETTILKKIAVITAAEEGLLGIAFHPQYISNGKIYLNYTINEKGQDTSRVSEWVVSAPADLLHASLGSERILMQVAQPYANHNAGQLAFGPDGMLYIGWGDGGFKDDPKLNGQNPRTFLGSMLRIDVKPDASGRPYSIPADNPYVASANYAPEVFAYGFRNPWRYSFDPAGRLIVADVGQDLWEEIDVVEKGGNYGWNVREGMHCFEPREGCATSGFHDPIYEYGRKEGQSVTGGYVYTGATISSLTGKYVFADFITGRIWALKIAAETPAKTEAVYTLGRWPVLISSFGRDAAGEIYAADFGSGTIFQFIPE